ncbi:hypothetical protein E1218_01565 [Kribbella turkmenica]|uniref:Uncharacterized protein n=1 Tax=Kribbella turkmenica TaxID=2530375 RepID=A0A4R4XHE9_9ACTN|nr:hypothetical protein [Kribbella turkmenica]TDD30273.1 hypothetical protein E1218_01565 [Kribbella turkmenica]
MPPAQKALTSTCAAMAAAIPLITLALWFVLAADGIGDFPPLWAPSVVLLAAAVAYAFCELAGFRSAPEEHTGRPAAEIGASSWQRFTASTFLRFAVCEASFLVSIPLAFVIDSFWVVLIGAALALPLFFYEVWPGARNQQRFAASLEARGVPSYLTGRVQDY